MVTLQNSTLQPVIVNNPRGMNPFIKNTIGVLLIVFLIVAASYIGLTIYGNTSCSQIKAAEPPSVDKAGYMIEIDANNNILYTNDYYYEDSMHVLNGWYEEISGKYIYREFILVLDETTFGNIIVERR